MKHSCKFKLERPARKSGGDRYTEENQEGVQPVIGTLYVNQHVTRSAGIPASQLFVTVSTVASDAGV